MEGHIDRISLTGPLSVPSSQHLAGPDIWLNQHVGNEYNNIYIEGGRTVLGNVYGQSSSDERALQAILESLSYAGMTDRRDTLKEAEEGTFDWKFLKGETKFVRRRRVDKEGVSTGDYKDVKMNFKTWLEADDQGLFCVMGKPGSGKSTFMCVHPSATCGITARAKLSPGSLSQRM